MNTIVATITWTIMTTTDGRSIMSPSFSLSHVSRINPRLNDRYMRSVGRVQVFLFFSPMKDDLFYPGTHLHGLMRAPGSNYSFIYSVIIIYLPKVGWLTFILCMYTHDNENGSSLM